MDNDDCTFILVDDDCSDTASEDLLTDSGYSVETEFFEEEQPSPPSKKEQRWRKWRLLRRGEPSASTGKGKRFVRAVRVRFEDLSKPYLAKITSQKNYTKFLQLVRGEGPPTDLSPDSGINDLSGMSPEDQEKQKEQWAEELAELEAEMKTLRDVLATKMKKAQELKRKLGFSVWKEFQDDMTHGIKSVKESNVYHTVEEKVGNLSRAVISAPIYQKTESVIKATTEKTSSLLGGIGSGISSKLGQLKNSESFRSFEEKVGTAYENVKVRGDLCLLHSPILTNIETKSI
ncbi:hypothetical protein AAG570_002290 [Ranatra chinensis]|uniref:Tumor protein D54 n=1 Tax=Ranatra chinensis TaxID=642074 RepID=A0ABD0YTT8_9HEMI